LVAIINRSLAKQIKDRYSGGAEMADALRQCAAIAGGTQRRSSDRSSASI
jgi:hypothetical protein